MSETKVYVSESTDSEWRKHAMLRFGYGKGSISKAAEEALIQWISKERAIEGRLDDIISRATGDNGVIAVLLFGSYARKEPDFRDIDIALLFDEKRGRHETSGYYQPPVAGVEIQISVINDMPLNIQSAVLNECKILYVRDREKLYDYSSRIIKDWAEFKPIFNTVAD